MFREASVRYYQKTKNRLKKSNEKYQNLSDQEKKRK